MIKLFQLQKIKGKHWFHKMLLV